MDPRVSRSAVVKAIACFLATSAALSTRAGPYAPAAGQPGSTAIAAGSPAFMEWATGFQDLLRGPMDIANPALGNASFGDGSEALGPAEGNSFNVVSLGDGGRITLTFAHGIRNGGADFAVFENGFADSFLELAFVEVSSDGSHFFRFSAVSLTQTTSPVGSFGLIDPTDIDDLAGKYMQGFGTPFDLNQLAGVSPQLDVNNVQFVRIVDVVGALDPLLGTRDSQGNLINDPYPTAFASGGFDLDGVGVINPAPEPASLVFLATALLPLRRRKPRAPA